MFNIVEWVCKQVKSYKIEEKDQVPEGKSICCECGGTGEIINYNHYVADTSIENRYVVCKRCFGTGWVVDE